MYDAFHLILKHRIIGQILLHVLAEFKRVLLTNIN